MTINLEGRNRAGKNATADNSKRPHQKKVIRYTENQKNYYIVGRYDFGSYLAEESQIDQSGKSRLATVTSEKNAINFILSGFFDEDEGITSPAGGTNLEKKFSGLLEENGLQDFKHNLIRYWYADKKAKNPLENITPKAKEISNMMLENFSMVVVDKNFPAQIISEQKLVIN